jgi:hypothetical protein
VIRPIDGEEFLDLFRRMRHSAYRLELRDRYNVTAETDRWNAFQSSDWARLDELNRVQRAPWMRLIGEATSRGKTVERVRVVSEPPTDYIRFELRLNAGNAEVGEDIRYLPRQETVGMELPGEDYWLFDSEAAVVLRFDEDDVMTGMELVDAPSTIDRYCMGRVTAWRYAVPYSQYIKKWTDLAESPPGA